MLACVGLGSLDKVWIVRSTPSLFFGLLEFIVFGEKDSSLHLAFSKGQIQSLYAITGTMMKKRTNKVRIDQLQTQVSAITKE